MRIALVTHTGQVGGAELATLRVIRALPRDLSVEAFLGEEGPYADQLRAAGVRVDILGMDERVRSLTRAETTSARAALKAAASLTPMVRMLARRLREGDHDVVWSASLKAHLLSVPAARLAGLPLVWSLHDRISHEYLPSTMVRLVRALARTAPRAIIANSEATAATVARVRELIVARPGLTPEQLRPLTEPPQRGHDVIGVVGRLSQTKGQLEVIRLMPDLIAARPGVTLRLIGGALFGQEDYEHALRAEVERLGLNDRVAFVGHIDDPRPELDALAVSVHAATIPEPFGQVIAESMARGTPVVATRGGGATELVHPPGEQPLGYLVPPRDPDAMVEAILDVLDAPERAEVRARRARAYVAEHLPISSTARTVAEVFQAVAAGRRSFSEPPVTLAHDYLTQRGGAERVVLAMRAAFPKSPLHTLLYEPATTFHEFEHLRVEASVLNRISTLRRNHRMAFPLLPLASSFMRVPGNVTVASTSGWAHAFRSSGAKIVYCHSPARWLYQTERYLGKPAYKSPIGLVLMAVGPTLRRWDRRRMRAADRVVVNSTAVQSAVADAYGIDAEVMHPPPGLSHDGPRTAIPGVEPPFYLVVSRLLPYKHVDVIVEAFAGLEDNLLVVGSGPMLADLMQDCPPNVRIVTDQTDAQLRWAYAHAQALIAASFEDFGLTPLEAALFGTPTLALRAGGYLDTVIEDVNGAFFDSADAADIRAAVHRNNARTWDAAQVIETVERFAQEVFIQRLRRVVEEVQATGRSGAATQS
ncbi:glycosyltransferase family 4 protein [Demetria terragena]|uniref:glycosyltransferase family 4 protein n=1 Tax=Demetria terragena TaxID=63959 RepID=UPI000365EBBA|nr:glycosyltransferase [Demetria terragena]